MKKTLTIITTTALLLGGVMVQVNDQPAYANSIDKKIKEIREKAADNKDEQNTIKSSIQSVENQKADTENKIKKLNSEVKQTEDEIAKHEAEIKKSNEEIEILKAEIVVTQKRIDDRDKLLKDRVKAMYVNGGTVSYLEVLLGAKSFGNFLDRVIALSTIAENDKQILEEQKADKKKLEDSKVEVETRKAAIEKSLEETEKLKASLEVKISEKNRLMESLNQKSQELHDHLMDIEEAGKLLKAQESAFIKEKKRQEEEARRRALAGQPVTTAPSGNGMIIRPVNGGYISSGFGIRWGNDYHPGIDIAEGGTVPVYAVADGTIFRSYRSSSYGECIFITHFINGQQWTTVYAHMRSGSRQVSEGTSVKRGQLIGYMGSTGDSTGQHLHFELHKGEWNYAKSNAVNPLNYIK